MPAPIIAGAVAGGLLNLLGGLSEGDAVSKQQAQAQANLKNIMNLITGARGRLETGGTAARGRLTESLAMGEQRLEDVLTGQQGVFQQTLADIQKSGRQQAAGSGLIGGGTESALVTPAITRAATNLGSQASQARLAQNQFATGQQSVLDQFLLGQMTGLDLSGIQGISGAQQNVLSTLQNYPQNPLLSFLSGGLRGAATGALFKR